jgi:hypothetical protein
VVMVLVRCEGGGYEVVITGGAQCIGVMSVLGARGCGVVVMVRV